MGNDRIKPTDTGECAHEFVDGCFHDVLCSKKIKVLEVNKVCRPYNLGCLGHDCPDFTTKTKKA